MERAASALDVTVRLSHPIHHLPRRLIRLQLKRFWFFAARLDHSQIYRRSRLDLALLGQTDCGVALAGVMLLNRGGGFHWYGSFMRQAGVFSNVDGDVRVQRLQRFGQELVGEGTEAVGAPVEPGPFQKVKSSETSTSKV